MAQDPQKDPEPRSVAASQPNSKEREQRAGAVTWEGGGEDAYAALTHQESPAGRGSGAAGGERRARPRARPAGGQRGAGAPAPRGTFLSRIQRRRARGGSAFRAVMLGLQSITVRTLGNILETFIK